MSDLFGNKLPDAKGFADGQTSKAKNVGENKISDVKGFGENKLNDTKNLGEGKLNEAKGFGEGKLNEVKGFGEAKLNEAKGFGEGKLNEAKGFGEGKLNEAKGFGEGKLNDVKGFSNNFSTFGSDNFDNSKSPSPFGSDDNKAAGFSGDSPSAVNTENTAASPFASSVPQQKSAPFGSESKTGSSSSGGTAPSGSPAVAGSGADKKKSEPKIYIVKQDDDLGLIAKKFHLPSWKYLYQINKSKIGDNPDLLKVGTELTIPQWDSTKGDELIREKGADPFAYTGGLQYRYPWVPFSVTLTDGDGKQLKENPDGYKIIVSDVKSGNEVLSRVFTKADEITLLIPDSPEMKVTVEPNSEENNGSN
jgi:nucleoid-associated protein YgaU